MYTERKEDDMPDEDMTRKELVLPLDGAYRFVGFNTPLTGVTANGSNGPTVKYWNGEAWVIIP